MSSYFHTDFRHSWADLKSHVSDKSLRLQYYENASQYWIWVCEGQLIYWCEIWKSGSTLPIGVDSTQNAADRTDFEAGFKPTANQPVVEKTTLEAWLGSIAPTVGQKAMASSIPVTLASNQTPLTVTLVPASAVTGLATGHVTLGGGTAGTLNVIRATTYNEQTTGAQRSLASSNANDTAAGTGARQVKITYLDASLNGPYYETVTLNGTAAVATVATNICFIERLDVVSVGSGATNAGTITLYVNSTGGGGTIGSIGVGSLVAGTGDLRTFWAHHYVATGKAADFTTLVVSAVSGGSGTNATFVMKSKDPVTANAPELVISDLLLVSGSIVRALGIAIHVIGPARVVAYGIPAVNNADLNATFDFFEQ
jgi:hypothetical protein